MRLQWNGKTGGELRIDGTRKGLQWYEETAGQWGRNGARKTTGGLRIDDAGEPSVREVATVRENHGRGRLQWCEKTAGGLRVDGAGKLLVREVAMVRKNHRWVDGYGTRAPQGNGTVITPWLGWG